MPTLEFVSTDLSTVHKLPLRSQMAWVLESLLNESPEFNQEQRELAYQQLDLYSQQDTDWSDISGSVNWRGQRQLRKIAKSWPDLEQPISEVLSNSEVTEESVALVLSVLTNLQETWAREVLDGLNARQVTASESDWQSRAAVPNLQLTADPRRLQLLSVLSTVVRRSRYINLAQKQSAMAGMWSLINPNRPAESLDGRMVDSGETSDTKIEYAKRAFESYPSLSPSVEALLTGGDVTDEMVTTSMGVCRSHRGKEYPNGTIEFRYRP